MVRDVRPIGPVIRAQYKHRNVAVLCFTTNPFRFLLRMHRTGRGIEWNFFQTEANVGEWFLDAVARLGREMRIPQYDPFTHPSHLIAANPDAVLYAINVNRDFTPRNEGAGYGWLTEVHEDTRATDMVRDFWPLVAAFQETVTLKRLR